jgi:hypothetical protein
MLLLSRTGFPVLSARLTPRSEAGLNFGIAGCFRSRLLYLDVRVLLTNAPVIQKPGYCGKRAIIL